MGIKIKLLPELERPREKAVRYGIETLSNIELLTMIVGSGTVGHSALDISYELINTFKGLKNLVSTSYIELKQVKGISDITALKLGATFELLRRYIVNDSEDENEEIDAKSIYLKYAKNLNDTGQENFGIIILNRNNKILREKFLYKGTNSEVSISYYELIKELLLVNGKHIYVFHNHPLGDATPSQKDVFFTRGLIQELQKIGVKLIDHVVLGDENFYSFKDGVLYELPK